jgi:predicted RNA binding protein YcfA (HicA-like mRNA interferase family)
VGTKDKLLAKLFHFPSDKTWAVADLIKLLELKSFSEVGGKGSHRVFQHPQLAAEITLAAHGKKIKPIYVKKVREAIQLLPL